MMKIKPLTGGKRAALGLAVLLLSAAASAICTTHLQYHTSLALRGVRYSAGADMPPGTVIYRQLSPGYSPVAIACTRPPVTLHYGLSGGALYPGTTDIWQSGIPGVGIRFSSQGRNLPFSRDIESGEFPASAFDLEIAAIKIGNITPGMVDISLMPNIRIAVTDADNQWVRVAYSDFTVGSMIVNVPTCTTPDFSYHFRETFTDDIVATPWMATPVTLTQCGPFHGNASNGSFYELLTHGVRHMNNFGSVVSQGTRAQNSVTMTLTPQTAVLDSARGIIDIASSEGAAEGVAIQLGLNQGGSWLPLNLSDKLLLPQSIDSSAGITFSLGARLLRRGAVIRAGAINASVIYTITYH